MSKLYDTKASMNDILELLKQYQTHNKSKQLPFKHTHNQSQAVSDIWPMQETHLETRLNSSLEKKKDQSRYPSTYRENHNNCFQSHQSNVFSRLYQEDKNLRQRRQKLYRQGRNSIEKLQTKECTFNPNMKCQTSRSASQSSIDSFYKKNIDWQNKKEKQIKKKQCQKSNQSVGQLTFTPQSSFNKKRIQNKQNNTSFVQMKGVQEFLNRQKAIKKNQKEVVSANRKNPYTELWNIKRGHFSKIH